MIHRSQPVLILALVSLTALLMSCTSCTVGPIAIADEELATMPPIRATVKEQSPCAALLQSEDGKRFYIGGPGASLPTINFVSSLDVGQTYDLPKALLDFQKGQRP